MTLMLDHRVQINGIVFSPLLPLDQNELCFFMVGGGANPHLNFIEGPCVGQKVTRFSAIKTWRKDTPRYNTGTIHGHRL
jgi:hypothetical protein